MIHNVRARRTAAAMMVAIGTMSMLFAPEIWAGLLLLIFGVALELAGIALGHSDRRH